MPLLQLLRQMAPKLAQGAWGWRSHPYHPRRWAESISEPVQRGWWSHPFYPRRWAGSIPEPVQAAMGWWSHPFYPRRWAESTIGPVQRRWGGGRTHITQDVGMHPLSDPFTGTVDGRNYAPPGGFPHDMYRSAPPSAKRYGNNYAPPTTPRTPQR